MRLVCLKIYWPKYSSDKQQTVYTLQACVYLMCGLFKKTANSQDFEAYDGNMIYG